MKEDIAALKEGDRSRSKGSKNFDGESSWRGRQSYYQIPDEEKVEIASMHLEGDALDLYSWLSNGQFILGRISPGVYQKLWTGRIPEPDEFFLSI
ncbi:hypothetical protein Tco_1434929 [Tanacetum coccineum]